MRSLPARESPEGNWTKKKSPSAIRRDRRRRSEFLRRKEPSHSPDTSKLDSPSSVTSPCSMGGATLEAGTSQEETLGIHDTARQSRSSRRGHNSGSAYDDDKGEKSPIETVREERKMGIKDLGGQVREGLEELERLLRYEKERLRRYEQPKVEDKSIKCPCCDEVISGVDHICDTYETLCEKINRGEFNSGKPLTDYQVEVLERRTPMI